MTVRLIMTLILLLFSAKMVQAEDRLVAGVVGEHWGYLTTVKGERHLRVVEMVLIDNPTRQPVPLDALIFDPKLTREFKEQYEVRFGRTEVEQNLKAPNRYSTYEYATGVRVTPEEDVTKKREYGEYMFRRLAEHHVDQYAKSSPNLRPMYELKERVSNVNLQVRKGYKVKLHYSFSGNYVDVNVDNPYEVSTKVTLQMDQDSFGPSTVNETILSLGYPVTTSVTVGSYYQINAGSFSLAGYKQLQSNLSTSITGSTHLSDAEKESRVIIGFTWSQ